jgi:hypothetical protein
VVAWGDFGHPRQLHEKGAAVWSHRISGPAWVVLFCALLGCGGGLYDADLLEEVAVCGNGRVDEGELCDTAITAGVPGACPIECEGGNACAPKKLVGPACGLQCVAVPIEQARSGDDCCPPGVTALQDSDCGSCGDAIVGPDETCDPVETCPTRATCETENACLRGVLSGDPKLCNVRCELKAIKTCRSEDGCCPAGCSLETDGDCSSTCGNGMVDRGSGETCETSIAVASCPTACDDGDPCTRNLMIGSSENCNSECTYPSIIQPTHEDGCCPTGASSLNDTDCEPTCGNGIAEPGEDCDGGDLCTPGCVGLTAEQRECSAIATTATDACHGCSCKNCATQVLACYASEDPNRDMLCAAVVECANQAACAETECYCGTSTDCAAPNGPCRMQIEQAAGSTFRPTVGTCTNTQSCSLYRSNAIGACRKANCSSECGLMPSAM